MAFMESPGQSDENLSDEMQNDINQLKNGINDVRDLYNTGKNLNNSSNNANSKQNSKGSSNDGPSSDDNKKNNSSINDKNINKINNPDNASEGKSNNSNPQTNESPIGNSADGLSIASDIVKDAVNDIGNKNKDSSDKADDVAKKSAKVGAEIAADAATGGAVTAAKQVVKIIKLKIILSVVKWCSIVVGIITIGVIIFVTLCPKAILGLVAFQYGNKDGFTTEELAQYKDLMVDLSGDNLSFWDVVNLAVTASTATHVSKFDMWLSYSYADDLGLTGKSKTVLDVLTISPLFWPVNYYNNKKTFGSEQGKEEAYAKKLQNNIYDIMENLGEWNPDDEFASSLEYNYNLCIDMAEKAYKKAISDAKSMYRGYKGEYELDGYKILVGPNEVLAREYYSWFDNESGSATYKDLFVDTNWGYVIATVDVLVNYNNEKEITGIYEFDINDYTLYSSYMKDNEPIENLYHIERRIEETTNDEGENVKIVTFRIKPFSLYDLFHMSLAVSNKGEEVQGNTKENYEQMEISPDKKWAGLTTFEQIVKARVIQMRDALANEDLIQKLGLRNEIQTGSESDVALKDLTDSSTEPVSGGTIQNFGEASVTVYKALTDTYGYSPMAASVICGNIQAESGFNTKAIDRVGAHGIMQWQGGNWTQLKSYADNNYDGDWTNLECQIRFMCEHYLPGKIPDIESYSTLEDMSGYFALKAEKCSSYTYLYLSELQAAGDTDNRNGGPCKCGLQHRWSTKCWETGRYNKTKTSNSVVMGCTDKNQYDISPSAYRYFPGLHKYIVGGSTRYNASVSAYKNFNGGSIE